MRPVRLPLGVLHALDFDRPAADDYHFIGSSLRGHDIRVHRSDETLVIRPRHMTSDTPPTPNNIGKRRKIKTISGSEVFLTVVDEIVVPQGKRKLIYFQQLQFEADSRIEYRLTYYMLGHKPARLGRWVFGQYSIMIPAEELSLVLKEARSRGWPGV
jgi:hypothetical protein